MDNIKEIEDFKSKILLQPLNSKEELRDWMQVFLDIKFPMGVVFPTSTHGPVEAMWRIYELFKTGESEKVSRVVLLSSRDSFKCSKKGTKIWKKDIGRVNIEDAKIGDIVWSGRSWRAVTDWIHDGIKPGITVELDNGEKLTGSPIHKIWCHISDTHGEAKDWVSLDNINPTKHRVEFQDTPYSNPIFISIKNIKKEESVDFYDLTVEGDHSYWSNGFVSHNTLSAAALEVLCMLHFRIKVAHGAAIKRQSENSIDYVNNFFRKLTPYLIKNNWTLKGISKTNIEWVTDRGEDVFLKIVVMTVAGMNGFHCPFLVLDEIDVVEDEKALKESAMIPSVKGSIFPVTLMLSTRKFSGGLMEKFVNETPKIGGEVLRWNILDVCSRITTEEARVDEPKVKRYVARHLPLSNISPEDFKTLSEPEKLKYEEFWAYAGIAEHPMLPVMRNYLVDRNQDDIGNLYKPVNAVWNNFKNTTPDMGEAQLLCNQPSSIGLVYSSFAPHLNTISIESAYEHLSGEKPSKEDFSLNDLISYMHYLGIEFYAGADWGSTDETSFTIFAKLASGHVWFIDLLSAPGLEIPEIVRYAKQLNEIYKLQKMYCDSAYPAYVKLVKAAGVPAVGVEKGPDSVINGIVTMQGKILSSDNRRLLKILSHGNTDRVIDAFGTYKWKLDGKGDPIDGRPDHGKDGTADIMDSARYCIYSLFGKGAGKVMFSYELEDDIKRKSVSGNKNIMQTKIQELTSGSNDGVVEKVKKRGILWDM